MKIQKTTLIYTKNNVIILYILEKNSIERGKMEKMKFERKINYYETDKMGIVHHSNYVRYLEEARCYMLDKMGMPYKDIEEAGILIPVLGINCEYKYPAKFEDTIVIEVQFKKYNGIRMEMKYTVTNKETGHLIMNAETKHCFTDENMKPIQLKKVKPDWNEKFYTYLDKNN